MAFIGSLVAEITLKNGRFLRSVRETEKSIKRLSKNVTAAGKALTLGVTLPIAGAATAMIKAASDAEETRNKFNVVFSSVSAEANSMAESLRNDFGLARTEARMLLSDTADLLSGFGFTQQAALDLSSQVNTLAVDLASFTNIQGGSERASKALTKALLGEREGAKELGIAILEADVKAKVLEMTQQGLTFETERQAKAYATLQIALSQSKNAIGDFARSQDSNANQTRILWARVKDLSDTLGAALLPTVTSLVSKGIELVDVFSRLNPETQSMAVQVALVAAAAGPAAVGLGLLFSSISGAVGVVGTIASSLSLVTTPLGIIGAGALVAAAGLIKMVGPVDALAVGWEALEQTQTFWAKQYDRSVTFVTKKTKDLRVLAVAADVIGKAWVGLRTVYSLFAAGIGIVIRDVSHGFAVLARAAQSAARALGLQNDAEIAGRFAAAFEVAEQAGRDFAQTNIEVAAETTKEWDNAFESLRDSGSSFAEATKEAYVAVKTIGSEVLNALQSESADKAAKIQGLIDKLKDTVVNITAKVQVQTEVPTAGTGTGMVGGGGAAEAVAARKTATDEIIALAQAQGEREIEQSKLTAEALKNIESSRLQSIIDKRKEALQASLDAQKGYAEKVGGVIENIGGQYADMLNDVREHNTTTSRAISNIWKGIQRSIISSLVNTTVKFISLSIQRIIQSKAETLAVVGDAATQATARGAAFGSIFGPAGTLSFGKSTLAAFLSLIGIAAGSAVGAIGGGGGGSSVEASEDTEQGGRSSRIASAARTSEHKEARVRIELTDQQQRNLFDVVLDQSELGGGWSGRNFVRTT